MGGPVTVHEFLQGVPRAARQAAAPGPALLPPLEESSSWQFLLLVLSLLAVVVGFTLLLLTGTVAAAGALIPELRSRFLPGVPEQVAALWSGPIGPVVMALFAGGWGCSPASGQNCDRAAGCPGC